MSPEVYYWSRRVGAIAAVVGLVLLVVGLLADVIGIGSGSGGARFGTRQVAAAAVGGVILVVGVVLWFWASRAKSPN